MKRVIALFVFAVMIGSLISVSAQLGQTVSTTTASKTYTDTDCVKIENEISQKYRAATFGIFSKDDKNHILSGLSTMSVPIGLSGVLWPIVILMTEINPAIAFAAGGGYLIPAIAILGAGLLIYKMYMDTKLGNVQHLEVQMNFCYQDLISSTGNTSFCEKLDSYFQIPECEKITK